MEEIRNVPDRVIPGYHASEGERVYKALSNLWERIADLELKAQSQQQPQYPPTVQAEPAPVFDDVPSKLLELQLKYTRKIIREHAKNQLGTGSLQQQNDVHISSSPQEVAQAYNNLDMVPIRLQKETQTSERTLPFSCSAVEENSEITRPIVPVPQEPHLEARDVPKAARSVLSIPSSTNHQGSSTRLKTSPHSHYHMKFSDVPFIVGQSAGISHSVTANVQSIIGLMKTHNPALCRTVQPSEQANRCYEGVQSFEDVMTVKEMKKKVKRLDKELSDMTVRQDSLRHKLKTTNQNDPDHVEACREFDNVSKLMMLKAQEIARFHQKLKSKGAKTSLNGSCPQMAVPATTQRDNQLMHKELLPRGKTVEAGQLRTVTATRPVRIKPSKKLQAGDVEWTHYK